MNILDALANEGIRLGSPAPGRRYTKCPRCSDGRKGAHKNLKVLGVSICDDEHAFWGCNHCGWTGAVGKPNGQAPPVTYDYTDENGELKFQKVRNPPGKEPRFWIRRPNGTGPFVSGRNKEDAQYIYRLPQVLEAVAQGYRIMIVEGEKDVDSLWRIGVPATCNPDGASEPGQKPKWRREHSEWLRGAEMIISGDDDAPGRAHIKATVAASKGIAASIRALDPKCWQPGKDVSDWLAKGGTREKLDTLIDGERPQPKSAPSEFTQVDGELRQTSDATALESDRADAFEMKAIEWLWPDRFAIGKLGIIAGMPDEGKGQILCYMAAKVTRGQQWPCGEGVAPLGNVIKLSAEDDPADTVVPRLVAAKADLTRIHFINMVKEKSARRMFNLMTDLERLKQKILGIGNVKLVLIDPISAYLGIGKVDSYRTTDVRAVLAPLVDMAAELKIAIVGIMHFNKKADVTNVLLRISDSLAYTATARHVYAVIDDPENKRKLFVKGKNNLARHDVQALAYNIGAKVVGNDPESGKEIWAPYIDWWTQHVDVTASEAMQAATENKAPAARADAKKFLEELLRNGPVLKTEIEDTAEGNGISMRTVERAKAELGVIAGKKAFAGKWSWEMPPPQPQRRYGD